MSKRLSAYLLNLKQNLRPIPVDNTGMWFQDKDVVVPSNQITMKGPDGSKDYFKEPIIGQGVQSGETKVMQPGKEYSFPNDRSVYERKMQNGAYTDNTRVNNVNIRNLAGNPVPSFLEDIRPQESSMISNVTDKIGDSFLNIADIGTDLMQVGNFIPYAPAQVVGKAGNVLGASIDAIQAKKAYDRGDNLDAAINTASAVLPTLYNPNYKRPISVVNPKNSPTTAGTYTHLNYLKPSHRGIPTLQKEINRNRAIATGLAAETLYDLNTSSPKPQIKQNYPTQRGGYQDNTRLAPTVRPVKPRMQEGGTKPRDYSKFQEFNKTLPPNLRNDNFKYNDPNTYDLYGMWEGSGKPNSFKEVKDGDFFPLQEDGTYHGFSVNPNTGEFLKPRNHATTWMEVKEGQLNPDLKDQLIIQNERGRLQYVPRTMQDGARVYSDNARLAPPVRLFTKEKTFSQLPPEVLEKDNTQLASQPITRAEDLPNFERIAPVEVKVKPSKNKNKEPKKTLKEIYEEATSKIKYDFGKATARDNTAVYSSPFISPEQKQKARIAEDYRQAKEVRVPGRLLNVLPTPAASYIRGLVGEDNATVDFTESQKRAAAYAIAKAEERGSKAGDAGYTGSFDYGDYPAGYRDDKGGAHNPALSNLFNLPSLDGKTKKRLENVTEYWGSAMMQPTLGKANFKKYNNEEYLIHDKYNFDSYNPNSKSIIDRAEKFANEWGVDTESNLTVPVKYVEEAKKQIATESQQPKENLPKQETVSVVKPTVEKVTPKAAEPVAQKSRLQESFNQKQSVSKKAVPTATSQPKQAASSNQLSGERLKVQNYQKMLNEKYGANLDADGAWGPRTQAAYEKFVLNKSMQVGGETSTEQNPESIGQVNVRAKDKGWFDNYVKRPLRKFGRSYAQRISDATGGSEWYKQSNPFMNLAFESMNAPQYAATYAATGKVQTPSEAMNIQNPYGAFAIDAVLDPTNLVGAGLAKQPLKAAGKNIVKSASSVTAPIVKYTDDVVQTSKLAGRPALPKYKDVYRAEHAAFNQAATPQDITGRWAVNNPDGANFYVQNLKDPNRGYNVINAFSGEQAPVKIMKQRLPEYKYNQQFGEAMPEEARIMSQGRGVMTDAQLNETLGPGSAQRFRTHEFSDQDLAAMETAPFLFNRTEGILDPNMINNLRQGKNTLSSKTSLFDNQQQAADYLLKQTESKQNVSSLNKYLPFNTFQMGGMSMPGVNGTVVASTAPTLYNKYKTKKK